MRFFLSVLLGFVFVFQSFGQETTGTIQGYVFNSDGEPVEFANVTVTDLSTNEFYGTTSQSNGFYIIQNLTPSFYRLEGTFVGFGIAEEENVKISLGAVKNQDLVLRKQGIEIEEVVVRSSKSDNAGNESFVSRELIEQTPTIFRSIQELTRSNPQNNLNSFGGASHRFNNLNIDGVASNDVIGFQEPASGAAGSQANGTPGSLSKSQPIGLGAIKELSVKLSPFDVSIGNFNGANIDIITKNGTNKFENSVFAYGNNQSTLGKYVEGAEEPVADFYDYQAGFSTGGPIKKNKIFYFANVEYADAQTPLSNAPGSAGSNISLEDVNAVRRHLMENYDYDPGAFEAADVRTASTKVFTRLDFVLSKKHKLTVRNNYVNSFSDNLEWNSNFFNFGNQGFRHNSVANSTVLELRSSHKNFFNKLNVGFNRVAEGRTSDGRIFPHLQIATSSSSRIFAGTYREASVFNTDFNTFQLTDKFSFIKGKHALSAGLQLQIHDVDYGFLSAWNGRWEYSSIENFLNDQPSRVRGVYNVNPANNGFDYVQNNPAGTIGVFESALYAQDKINLTRNFDITAGVRFDGQFLTQPLPLSPLIANSQNFNQFTNKLNNNIQVNPRVGFNFRPENTKLTFRAGTGLFSGKLPYLWFGYLEYISGTEYFNIDIRPNAPLSLTEDLGSLQRVQADLTEVNLLDPDFKYPRDWKTDFGIDWKPASEWDFSATFSYTDVLQGLIFQTANRNEVFANFDGADNRQYYNTTSNDVKVNSNFTNVFVLANTQDGFRYNLTLNAARNTKKSYSSIGYSYGLSKDVSSTVRSSPAANYEWNQALLGNEPGVSFSNYDLRHKIIAIQSFRVPFGKNDVLVSLLYNGRSGAPYSIVYQGDLNRDGSSRNDLVYVPNDASEISFVEIEDGNGNIITAAEQWENLNNYINDIDYLNERRGDYVERNGAKTPWNHQLDMKFEFGRNLIKNDRLSLSLDIFNVLNLMNRDWGRLVFVPNVVNSSFSLLKFESVENNVPQYSFNIDPDQTPWVTDAFNSRWRMQVGLKYDF